MCVFSFSLKLGTIIGWGDLERDPGGLFFLIKPHVHSVMSCHTQMCKEKSAQVEETSRAPHAVRHSRSPIRLFCTARCRRTLDSMEKRTEKRKILLRFLRSG